MQPFVSKMRKIIENYLSYSVISPQSRSIEKKKTRPPGCDRNNLIRTKNVLPFAFVWSDL